MRELLDAGGDRWRVELISHGRTSGYLNPKVHRPILQFTCLSRPRPRRYAPVPPGWVALEEVDDPALRTLLAAARVY